MKMTTCCTSAIVPVDPCIADRLSARIATNRPVVLTILIRNIDGPLRLWTSSSPHISQPTKFNYGTMQLYHSLSSSSFLKGRILTLPPQHRTSPRDRTASRPRLAARSTAQVALNLFTRAIAFGAAASRGRLAVRWQCQDAPREKRGTNPSFPGHVSARNFDFLVLGSGIAGLSFALKVAPTGRVAIITKKDRAESNTNYAQGGIAAVTSKEDSFELHVRDTLQAGAGLCKEEVVRTVVQEGPERIAELIELGMKFSEREVPGPNGARELDLGREGGHSKRRILHAKDVTGREIERALLSAVAQRPNIRIFENHLAIDLVTTQKLTHRGRGVPPAQLGAGMAQSSGDSPIALETKRLAGRPPYIDRCVGVYVLDNKTGKVETFVAPVVLLATGGCGKVDLYTTNPDIATGDGVAMAYRAGAA